MKIYLHITLFLIIRNVVQSSLTLSFLDNDENGNPYTQNFMLQLPNTTLPLNEINLRIADGDNIIFEKPLSNILETSNFDIDTEKLSAGGNDLEVSFISLPSGEILEKSRISVMSHSTDLIPSYGVINSIMKVSKRYASGLLHYRKSILVVGGTGLLTSLLLSKFHSANNKKSDEIFIAENLDNHNDFPPPPFPPPVYPPSLPGVNSLSYQALCNDVNPPSSSLQPPPSSMKNALQNINIVSKSLISFGILSLAYIVNRQRIYKFAKNTIKHHNNLTNKPIERKSNEPSISSQSPFLPYYPTRFRYVPTSHSTKTSKSRSPDFPM